MYNYSSILSSVHPRLGFVNDTVRGVYSYLSMTDAEKGADLIDRNLLQFKEWVQESVWWRDEASVQEIIEADEDSVWDLYLDTDTLPKKLLIEYLQDFDFNGYDDPAWAAFGSPTIVKNTWLIHFTDDAGSIAAEGFRFGAHDLDQLALTTSWTQESKKGGTYVFAYDASDYEKYTGSSSKYGSEAVLFRASGVSAWHQGDRENQVIFDGRTAKYIIPLYEYNGEWMANGIGKNGREEDADGDNLFDSHSEAVDWVTKNFRQYRKVLLR